MSTFIDLAPFEATGLLPSQSREGNQPQSRSGGRLGGLLFRQDFAQGPKLCRTADPITGLVAGRLSTPRTGLRPATRPRFSPQE
jgi:hypothetical protein